MCLWQALHAMDHAAVGDPPKDLVKQVTSIVMGDSLNGFSDTDFESYFKGKSIEFNDYVKYIQKMKNKLEKSIWNVWETVIEEKCWEVCKFTYGVEMFRKTNAAVRMLWDIFNQLCEPGTLPPLLDQEEANWISDKISTRLGQNWNCTNITTALQFTDFVRILHEKCFFKAPASVVLREISSFHSWMVKEVIYSGWLYKCSFKLGHVHGMDKKWFVLVPSRLIYYHTRKMKWKEGEIPVTDDTRLDHLPNFHFNLLAQNCKYRFLFENPNGTRVELAAISKHQKMAWMDALTEVIQAAKAMESPLHLLKRDRKSTKQSIGNTETNSKKKDGAGKQSSKQSLFGAERYKPMQEKKEAIPQILPMLLQDEKVKEKVDKIQVIFCNFDKDSNGAIDRFEFKDFVKSMGLKLDDKEIDVIFSKIEDSEDGIITMDEFTEYFMNNVLNVTGQNSNKAEADFQAAFMQADRDGTGTIDFMEFTDYICEKNRNMKSSEIMKIFSQLAQGDDELSMDKFTEFFSQDGTENNDDQTLDGQLMNMYSNADAEYIANYLHERWSSFASFKRAGASGDLVMTGGEGMVADVLPGQYSLVDLACYTDLPPITPRYAEIENVCWIKSPPKGHGKVIFPPSFDGHLPVDIATTEHLRYYGASLADSTQVEVSLMCRHGIQDFTYESNYLEDYVESENGGCGLEMHDFAHLDCPLQDDSGYFIIGKMLDQTLHLTAFKVPTRHTLYLPGGLIHSNDYMKGTWRTMLSDATAIDHCHIMKRIKANNDNDLDSFEFSFEKYI